MIVCPEYPVQDSGPAGAVCEEPVPRFRRGGDSGHYRGCQKTSSLCQFTQDTLTQGGFLTIITTKSSMVLKYVNVIFKMNVLCFLVGVHITRSAIN